MPALRRAADVAAVYRWLALLVDELFVVVHDRLAIEAPADADIERMVERIRSPRA